MVLISRRPRFSEFCPVALVCLAMVCLLHVQHHLYMSLSGHDIAYDSRAPDIPWQVVYDTYEAERQILLEDYDTNAVSRLFATLGTSISPDLTTHVGRLRDFVDEYFEGSSIHAQLNDSIYRLENHQRPSSLDYELPKRVWSTNKGGKEDLSWYFDRWKQFLGPLGWNVTVMADVEMEEMLPIFSGGPCRGSERFRNLWHALPTPVLKGDLLR